MTTPNEEVSTAPDRGLYPCTACCFSKITGEAFPSAPVVLRELPRKGATAKSLVQCLCRLRLQSPIAGRAVVMGAANFMTKDTGFEALMHEVCVEWGFCGCAKYGKPLNVSDFIPRSGLVTVDQFVEWVFLADDMNPNSDPERWRVQKRGIRDAFIKHMGGKAVDAEQLRWRNRRDKSKASRTEGISISHMRLK